MSASTSPAPRSTPPSTAARSRPASPSGAIPCRTGSSSRSRARATAPTARTWLKRAKASNFVEQGLVELGDKLGPINWQLAATKQFDPDEIAAFFALLPAKQEGLVLRHAIEPRHESFRDPAFLDLARKAGVAVILADSAKYPAFEDAAEDSPFLYARLQNAQSDLEQGYPSAQLTQWAKRAQDWSKSGKDVFLFFINGAKERAPAAAMALIEKLKN